MNRGDRIWVSTWQGTVEAEVDIVSENGDSVFVSLSGLLNGHLAIPLLRRDGVFRSILNGDAFALDVDRQILRPDQARCTACACLCRALPNPAMPWPGTPWKVECIPCQNR